ncbi:hypothetical protein IscW_ISCW016627 [Ixodes scapularis]|uniref:Uncharacterized protein n=1 Tax=Ixodes scapularis TaxID=6945 RepID=B7PC08_IXOSC|nr:hypothetical protein IscW_ISCW016627 [Ixodes scapularis]|eukprot:XP_002409209.1 hypothetical protein IscW_ISCW016627 [Ixodes scapularis]
MPTVGRERPFGAGREPRTRLGVIPDPSSFLFFPFLARSIPWKEEPPSRSKRSAFQARQCRVDRRLRARGQRNGAVPWPLAL